MKLNYFWSKKITIFFVFIMVVLSSCEKYVNIKRNSGIGTLETAKDAQLLLDTYSIMNVEYASDAQLSADDFFISNQTYTGGNLEDRAIYTWQNIPRASASPNWQNLYQIVYRANLAIETVDRIKSVGTDPSATVDALNNIRGSGLFYRAYCFWNIAQLYAKPYTAATASVDLGIPLRLSSDINGKSVRGTTKETYDQITQDLTEAVSLLPNTAIAVSRPSKVAAYAMLARVYLSMEDYANALANANAALQIKNDLLNFNSLTPAQISSNVPFTRFNIEVLFHSQIASSSFTNPGNANNPVARVDLALAASYDNNDLRRTVFLKPNNINLSYTNSSGSVVTASVPDFTYRFSGNYEQTSNATQFNGLAVDELYLIVAECEARLGNKDSALANLNLLLQNRYINNSSTPFVNITAGTASDALDLILSHRRKELLMRSQRWTDLRRLNKDPKYKKDIVRNISDITVTGTSPTNYNVVYTPRLSAVLEAGAPGYTLLIPTEVIINAGLEQNQR